MKLVKQSILLIDDDPVCNHLNLRTLDKLGYEVMTFTEARYAIQHLELINDSNGKLPSLILLDIDMPEMSGFDCIEELHASSVDLSNTEIVLLSSLDESLFRDKMKKGYFFLPKPLNKDKVKFLEKKFNLSVAIDES